MVTTKMPAGVSQCVFVPRETDIFLSLPGIGSFPNHPSASQRSSTVLLGNLSGRRPSLSADGVVVSDGSPEGSFGLPGSSLEGLAPIDKTPYRSDIWREVRIFHGSPAERTRSAGFQVSAPGVLEERMRPTLTIFIHGMFVASPSIAYPVLSARGYV